MVVNVDGLERHVEECICDVGVRICIRLGVEESRAAFARARNLDSLYSLALKRVLAS